MTKEMQPEALRVAAWLINAPHKTTHGDMLISGRELRRLHARVQEQDDALQFVERWAVHHGTKPGMTAEEALSCIQHYPPIREITKNYADGKVPNTFDPYARIAELEAQLEAQREPLTADGIMEPKNGEKWRVVWWNESCRMMLPSDKVLDGFQSYKNGTLQFTLKQHAHGITGDKG